jgi:hypothetical protein
MVKLVNKFVNFFAQGRFFNANDLSHFGGCGTRTICSSKWYSDILAIPVLLSRLKAGLHRDSLNAQAPLAKIDIRSKTAKFIFRDGLKNGKI